MAPAIIRFGPNACARHSSFPTPFCRLSKGGSAGAAARSSSMTAAVSKALTVRIARSTCEAANASARVVNAGSGGVCRSPPGSTRRMPALCATSTTKGRPTSVTRFPARASRAPMKEPTAPAPMIRIFTGVRVSYWYPSTTGCRPPLRVRGSAQDQLRPYASASTCTVCTTRRPELLAMFQRQVSLSQMAVDAPEAFSLSNRGLPTAWAMACFSCL